MSKVAKRPKQSSRPTPPFESDEVQRLLHLTRLAELGRMAANVAHEVNNPLMAVQGLAENIELMLDQPNMPREDVRLQILEIQKSCQRMSRIITKMNRMSRSQQIRLFVVDLAELSLNAVDFVKRQIAEFEVQVDFAFDRPIPIKCDSVQIEQIILNILRNALFALERGRKEDRQIRISFEEDGKQQKIKIWNNGPAIAKDMQAKISAPFFTTKAEGEGTGLGLSISRTIMHIHHGDLSFTSNEKHGTEFCLSFPRPQENPWARRKRQSVGTIVIIDPQVNSRRTLEEKFNILGFQVRVCGDYPSGLEALAQLNLVAGVFVDVIPGQKESLAYVEQLRQRLGSKCLIFAVSNYFSARDWRSELKDKGATECFEKPFRAANFTYLLKLLDTVDFAAA